MKRTPLNAGRKSVERGSTFKRKPRKRLDSIGRVAMVRERKYKDGARGRQCEAPGCTLLADHAHHIIEKAQLKKIGADLWDERNRLALCAGCHANHHAAAKRLPLPARAHPVWAFAAELGLEWWLLRYYTWPDSRFSTS